MSATPFTAAGRAQRREPLRPPLPDAASERASEAVRIERILCPTDFSDASHTALRYATALAQWHDAEIRVLHVVDTSPVKGAAAPALNYFKALNDEARAGIWRRLRASLEPVEAAGVIAASDVRIGNTVDEIVAYAKTSRADVVVMGTRGLSGMKRFMLGSTTERVLQAAGCPVLTVPPQANPVPAWHQTPFSRILCPVDFSPPSLEALELAVALAQEANGSLTLFHAVSHLMALAGGEHIGLAGQWEHHSSDLERDALARLRRLIPDDVRAWCSPDVLVLADTPVRAILTAAKQRRAELIVMSVGRRGSLDRVLFGSTTQAVIRYAECPVLTIRGVPSRWSS